MSLTHLTGLYGEAAGSAADVSASRTYARARARRLRNRVHSGPASRGAPTPPSLASRGCSGGTPPPGGRAQGLGMRGPHGAPGSAGRTPLGGGRALGVRLRP